MKKKLKLIVMLLMFMSLIVACAYGEEETPAKTSGDNQIDDTTDDNSSEDTASAGGKISIPIVADPTFNPWHPNSYAESNVVNRVLFSGLTKPGKDLLPIPDLAKDWITSEDELVWTFFLREDVLWHDGEQFTAEDVAFTFNEIALNESLGANNTSSLTQLREVEIVDEFTVKFHLNNPVAALPANLSFNTEIIPKHIFEGEDPWELTSFNKDQPVGTGAFKMKSYTSGQSVILERNDDYYGDVALLDEIEYRVLPDVNTHIAQVLSGELSIFSLDDTSAISRIESSDGVAVYPRNTTRFFWISLNQEHEKYQDKRVRQAMVHAIDRQNIIDTVLQGYGQVADAGIAPALAEYYTDDVPHFDYDPDRAMELLAEAGWVQNEDGILEKDGETFEISFEIGIQGDLEPVSQLVQQYLISVGFDVTLKTMEWNTMIEQVVINRDYDMSLNWWRYPSDPDLLPYLHSSTAGTGYNIPGYKNEEMDRLLEAGARESDVEKRKETYIELQELMAEEQPYIFLWYPEEAQVKLDELKGVPELAFGDALHYINEWYLEK